MLLHDKLLDKCSGWKGKREREREREREIKRERERERERESIFIVMTDENNGHHRSRS